MISWKRSQDFRIVTFLLSHQPGSKVILDLRFKCSRLHVTDTTTGLLLETQHNWLMIPLVIPFYSSLSALQLLTMNLSLLLKYLITSLS